MMGSQTLPRGFRFHHEEEAPKTPEPLSTEEPVQPSPPRQRLKVRRRNASSLQAPTEQFLASVAAADLPNADIPIPTIEIPRMLLEDSEMVDRDEVEANYDLLAPHSYRFASPPKTPMPGLTMEDEAARRPDWSMVASPSEEPFQRPGSSMSDNSDDDSLYSGSRASRPSDDGSCTSPESEAGDPFQFPVKGKGRVLYGEPMFSFTPLNGQLRSKTRKNAAWTQAQSSHLWSTYNIYLQDPTVTPFRIGASKIPPEGVCHRVAREARRSWKGPKSNPPKGVTKPDSKPALDCQSSGSATPTEAPSNLYAQWPHSSSATRNHLREMCKSKTSGVSKYRHFQSRSPTPFTKPRRMQTPEPRPMSFSTKDIGLSLTTSTSVTMQPGGPLSALATEPVHTPSPRTFNDFQPRESLSSIKTQGLGVNTESTIRRLGSPFVTRTYGPSSSKGLWPYDTRPSPPRTQSDLQGPSLGSPLHFKKPRSLNNTQKRRAQHDLEEELSPTGAIVRPSILNEQLFGTPFAQRRVRRSRGFSLGDEALRHHTPTAFQVSPPPELPSLPNLNVTTQSDASSTSPLLLNASPPVPPRLGSPFGEPGTSHTFPRRLPTDESATIRRSAFATMHQTRRSIESFDFGKGASLQTRLAQLDNKLQQIRERDSSSSQHHSN